MRTLSEIDAEMRELESQREALKERLRMMAKERDVAFYAEEMSKMPASKLDAFRQVLAAGGIPSAEAFGKIGG